MSMSLPWAIWWYSLPFFWWDRVASAWTASWANNHFNFPFMKKIDLIHTTILIVALLNAYSALEYFMGFITSLFSGVDLYHWQIPDAAISNLIVAGVFFGACVLLVKNGRKYAAALLPNEEEASWDNATEWQLDRRNILFVFFIGMGLYT